MDEKKKSVKKPAPLCPTCRQEVKLLVDNRAYPFCSPRCQRLDLAKWLGEGYRIPGSNEGGTLH